MIIIHCVLKNIPDIFDCNLKTNYQILIIFGKNIPDTTYQQKTIQFPTSLNVSFSTTWGEHNQRNITFVSNEISINITCKTHFVHISDTVADNSSSCLFQHIFHLICFS